MSKRKPGRKPTLPRPTSQTSMVIFADQYANLERYASARRISHSEVFRQALDLFFAVNSDFTNNQSVNVSTEAA